MNRRLRSLLLSAAIPMAMCAVSTSAFAEQYDANCNPVPREEERLDMEIAKSWLPIGLGLQLADKICQGHQFIMKLLTREPDPEKITTEEVFEAARPEVPNKLSSSPAYKRESDAAERLRRQAESTTTNRPANAADEAVAEANRREEEARRLGRRWREDGAEREPW